MRPWWTATIDELEAEFARAGRDLSRLDALALELRRRKTARAARLLESVNARRAHAADGGDLLRPDPEPVRGDRTYLRKAIEDLRRKLIDISKANPMIAYRHAERGASYLRIIDASLNALHGALTEGRALSFEPLPDPRAEPADQKTPEFRLALQAARLTDAAYLGAIDHDDGDEAALETAERGLTARVREQLGLPRLSHGAAVDLAALSRANGVDPSLELGAEARAADQRDRRVRVLLLPDKLEARLRTIRDRYAGHAAETGIHTLQLVFGFLEWREAASSELAFHAPLLTLAVDLNRVPGPGGSKYELVDRDEPLAINMALQEKLRQEFDFTLPDIEDGESPGAWLARAAAAVQDRAGLRVLRWATLAVLPFPNMAVWRDLDPEAWPALLDQEHVAVLLGGRTADEGQGFPPDYPIDDKPVEALPPLILEADVSQHSALIDAHVHRRSLAIEGPPGTGKSQTIANLIAGALDAGRRVLFVAEKRAALEVVAQRLKAVGLGSLLLELHSDKATKTEVLDGLRRALNAKAARGPSRGEAALNQKAELGRQRDLLRSYRRLLQTPLGALGRTAAELVWREMRLRSALSTALPRAVWDRGVGDAQSVTPQAISDAREALDRVEAAATQVGVHGAAQSPWASVGRAPANPIGQAQALDRLEAVVQVARALTAWRDAVGALAGQVPERLDSLLATTQAFADAPRVDGVPEPVLTAFLKGDQAAERLLADLQLHQRRRTRLTGSHRDPLSASPQDVRIAAEAAEAAERPGATPAQLQARLAAAEAALAEVRTIREAAAPILSALTIDPDAITVQQLIGLTAVIGHWVAISPSGSSLAWPLLLDDDAEAKLADGATQAALLGSRRDALGSVDWQALGAERVDALFADAEALATTAAPLRLFSGRYKRARLAAVEVLGSETPKRAADAAVRLKTATQWRQDAEQFRREHPARALFASVWKGCDSDWAVAAAIRETLAEGERALGRVNLSRVALSLASARRADLALWAERLDAAPPLDAPNPAHAVAAVEARAALQVERLSRALEAAKVCGVLEDAALTAGLADELLAFQGEHWALKQAGHAHAWFAGPDQDSSPLERAAAWVAALRRAAIPASVFDSLRKAEDLARVSRTLGDLHRDGQDLRVRLESTWDAFAVSVEAQTAGFIGAPGLDAAPLPALAERLATARAGEGDLRLHAALGVALREADAAGVRWVYDSAVANGAQPVSLADAYEAALLRSLLSHYLQTDGRRLGQLAGARVADTIKAFNGLDRRLAELEAEHILHERQGDAMPLGNGSGPVGSFTQGHLIRHVVERPKARVTLRALIQRAGEAVQALKPVWMMSPTTVAQFAPPDTVGFDLVVIDEASQMTPEMAIGALARGAQIVVVGDPKQLPPSDHFKATISAVGADDEEDDEDGRGVAMVAESILDLAYQRLGSRRRLKWHYRSRHEQLIQFSNRDFYEGDLVVFPSAAPPGPFLGVRTIQADGLYKGRVNQKEAEAVIDAAFGLMTTRPDLSLGVVATNSEQRELLFQMFDQLRESDPAVRDYVAGWEDAEGGVESFFVKNLENVQGDERDVIILSTVYGPESPGAKVKQRFGMLNRRGGERWLNVLVTRAKSALWLVTSLRASDVVVDREQGQMAPKGVQALHRYLVHAAGGASVDPVQPVAEADSDFEVFVADRLRANGYEVTPQVGVDRYRIDLGIRHPAWPDGYLAGVECDGAAFHSHYTVRDRDRIRQAVLEGLGWRIWRIWSTDWFNDPERETDRLLAWLGDLRREAEARQALRMADAAERAPDASPQEPEPELIPPTEPQHEAPPPRGSEQSTTPPVGRARRVDAFTFYEDPVQAGSYTVWDEDVRLGVIERPGGAAAPARLFGGRLSAPQPTYVVRRDWDETSFISDDIYAAVRKLGEESRLGQTPDRRG